MSWKTAAVVQQSCSHGYSGHPRRRGNACGTSPERTRCDSRRCVCGPVWRAARTRLMLMHRPYSTTNDTCHTNSDIRHQTLVCPLLNNKSSIPSTSQKHRTTTAIGFPLTSPIFRNYSELVHGSQTQHMVYVEMMSTVAQSTMSKLTDINKSHEKNDYIAANLQLTLQGNEIKCCNNTLKLSIMFNS